jgi:hypothetical protein
VGNCDKLQQGAIVKYTIVATATVVAVVATATIVATATVVAVVATATIVATATDFACLLRGHMIPARPLLNRVQVSPYNI